MSKKYMTYQELHDLPSDMQLVLKGSDRVYTIQEVKDIHKMWQKKLDIAELLDALEEALEIVYPIEEVMSDTEETDESKLRGYIHKHLGKLMDDWLDWLVEWRDDQDEILRGQNSGLVDYMYSYILELRSKAKEEA